MLLQVAKTPASSPTLDILEHQHLPLEILRFGGATGFVGVPITEYTTG